MLHSVPVTVYSVQHLLMVKYLCEQHTASPDQQFVDIAKQYCHIVSKTA